jgi:hypothetical protein
LCKNSIHDNENYIETLISKEMQKLTQEGFVEDGRLSQLGEVAVQLNEINPLFSKIVSELSGLSTRQIIGLFSCFTDMKCEEPSPSPFTEDEEIIRIIEICKIYNLEMTYDFIDVVMKWCDCEDEVSCKWLLQENEIFLGDFVKGLLKIVNIAREIEKVALFLKSPLAEPVSNIPNKILKYMVNSQSLYI